MSTRETLPSADAPPVGHTLSDCLQVNLLEAADAGADAARNFRAMDTANHLRSLAQQLQEAGYRAQLDLDKDGWRARLTWRMASEARPRERYVLEVAATAAGATARFIGPARSTALFLRTRNASTQALRRWSTTFVEWALTTHEEPRAAGAGARARAEPQRPGLQPVSAALALPEVQRRGAANP